MYEILLRQILKINHVELNQQKHIVRITINEIWIKKGIFICNINDYYIFLYLLKVNFIQ